MCQAVIGSDFFERQCNGPGSLQGPLARSRKTKCPVVAEFYPAGEARSRPPHYPVGPAELSSGLSFIAVSCSEHGGLVEVLADQHQSHREPVCFAARNRDGRMAGDIKWARVIDVA